MSIFLMVLTCLNIILVLGLSFSVFLRVKEKKEDQRITKGLQLLQHKISILQDLSDKTDEQVQRLVFMLDSKSNELRRLTLEASQAALNAQQTLQNTPKEMPAVLNTVAPMDELSQFVQALSLQNEKIKAPQASMMAASTPALSSASPMPQDFVINSSEENIVAETSSSMSQAVHTSASNNKAATPAVKLFQFKKI